MTRFRFQLLAATFARTIVNTAHRMVYPFLPAISRGLGVPLESLTYVLSARAALGMTSPFFGVIPDRFGRKLAMLLGLGLFCAAMLLLGIFPTYVVFFGAIVAVVAAKFIFDPALQAYIGDRTPYSQRGLVIALTEIGWSGAALAGFPLVGLMIERWGWRSPFLPLAGLGLLGGAAIWFLIPRQLPVASNQSPVISQQSAISNQQSNWASVWANPRVLAALSIGMWISAANESLNVVFGDWMETTFGLPVVALGLSTTVIGVAELAGEGLVMWLADRLGKRRAIGFGLIASAAAYLAMPLLAFDLNFALAAIFFVFIAFEFTIVASIPMMTEMAPRARGTAMSANVAFHAAGRTIGALAGGYVYRFGFGWNAVVAAVLNLIALAIVVGVVRERKE